MAPPPTITGSCKARPARLQDFLAAFHPKPLCLRPCLRQRAPPGEGGMAWRTPGGQPGCPIAAVSLISAPLAPSPRQISTPSPTQGPSTPMCHHAPASFTGPGTETSPPPHPPVRIAQSSSSRRPTLRRDPCSPTYFEQRWEEAEQAEERVCDVEEAPGALGTPHAW